MHNLLHLSYSATCVLNGHYLLDFISIYALYKLFVYHVNLVKLYIVYDIKNGYTV